MLKVFTVKIHTLDTEGLPATSIVNITGADDVEARANAVGMLVGGTVVDYCEINFICAVTTPASGRDVYSVNVPV